MKLLFLHGAPAAGKLTVAKALLQLVPGRLFDNHAAIDLARTLFDFGAPGFWELVHATRYAALDIAAEHDVALVVTTFCYADPLDLPQFEKFESILQGHCGELLPVFLHCSREEAVAPGCQSRQGGAAQDRVGYLPDQRTGYIPVHTSDRAPAALRWIRG